MKKIASAIVAAALGATLAVACGGKAAPAETTPDTTANPCNPCGGTEAEPAGDNPCNPCGAGDMGGDTYGGAAYGG